MDDLCSSSIFCSHFRPEPDFNEHRGCFSKLELITDVGGSIACRDQWSHAEALGPGLRGALVLLDVSGTRMPLLIAEEE